MVVKEAIATPINGRITDIVDVGEHIADATKKLLDAGYKLYHIVPLGSDGENDRHKYIFIKKIKEKGEKCKCKGTCKD